MIRLQLDPVEHQNRGLDSRAQLVRRRSHYREAAWHDGIGGGALCPRALNYWKNLEWPQEYRQFQVSLPCTEGGKKGWQTQRTEWRREICNELDGKRRPDLFSTDATLLRLVSP